jgi:hypothetical protein
MRDVTDKKLDFCTGLFTSVWTKNTRYSMADELHIISKKYILDHKNTMYVSNRKDSVQEYIFILTKTCEISQVNLADKLIITHIKMTFCSGLYISVT